MTFQSKPRKPLKRSAFKKKQSKPLKRTSFSKKVKKPTKLPKPKLPSTKSLEKKVWELCKILTRKKYGNTCYTSGQKNLVGANWQTGHGKPKGCLPMKYKYDLRNLRPQSYNANINLGGQSDIFIAKMEREKEGLEFLEEVCIKQDGRWELRYHEPMGGTEAKLFLIELIEKYKSLIK